MNFNFFHDENEIAYTEDMRKEREYLKEQLQIIPEEITAKMCIIGSGI